MTYQHLSNIRKDEQIYVHMPILAILEGVQKKFKGVIISDHNQDIII